MDSNGNQKCPICGGNDLKTIGRPQLSYRVAEFAEKEFWVVKCQKCQFYFVLPPIEFSVQQWEKLYDGEYFEEMTKWWARRREKDREERLDRLEAAAKQKIVNFLDVGCGEGYVLLEAVKRGWKAHGVDISDNRIELARGSEIDFIKADIFEAQYPDNYFDCIYMDSVLEHVPCPVSHLNELMRIMKEEGVLYVGVPNEDSLFNDVKALLYFICGKSKISPRIKPFISPFHVSGFTKKSLITSALKCNFKVVDFRNFGGQYELLKFKAFSKPFLINMFLLPIHLAAIVARRQIYLDIILQK